MAGWQGVQAQVSTEQMSAVVDAAARDLSGLPLAVLRNRSELGQRADAAVRAALRPYPVQVSASQMQALIAQVVARVGGLGFLDALIPPNSDQFTDLLVKGNSLMEMICSFLAVLELVRRSELQVRQETLFGSITLLRLERARQATPSVK